MGSANHVPAFPTVVASEVPCKRRLTQRAVGRGLVWFPVGCHGRAEDFVFKGEGGDED